MSYIVNLYSRLSCIWKRNWPIHSKKNPANVNKMFPIQIPYFNVPSDDLNTTSVAAWIFKTYLQMNTQIKNYYLFIILESIFLFRAYISPQYIGHPDQLSSILTQGGIIMLCTFCKPSRSFYKPGDILQLPNRLIEIQCPLT